MAVVGKGKEELRGNAAVNKIRFARFWTSGNSTYYGSQCESSWVGAVS